MCKYKFKAKDIKTGKLVEGDLIYARQVYPHKPVIIKPMIVEFNIHGGIMWTRKRHFVDESTIELITEDK
jgi:hypothetical protein